MAGSAPEEEQIKLHWMTKAYLNDFYQSRDEGFRESSSISFGFIKVRGGDSQAEVAQGIRSGMVTWKRWH